MRTPWAPVMVLLLALTSACGSRSALLGPSREQQVADAAPPGADATLPDPCAPPSVTAACASEIAGAPAGSPLWTASLETGSDDLLGPVAADASGMTYFLSAEDALYVKRVFALDACGALRWQADVSDWLVPTGYVPQVMVAGEHLLLVTVGAITALSADSGELVWTADLDAFAKAGGLGVSPGKVQSLGFTAARSDGTAFSVVANDLDAWIVRVSAAGKPSPVAKVGSYLGGLGYPFGAQQLVLDAAGDVVLAGGENPGSGDRIDAFTASGASVFSTTLPSWGNSRYLAAGPDFVTGEYLWLLGLDGELRNKATGGGPTFVYWGSPTLIDEDGNLLSIGGQHLEPGSSKVTFNLLGGFDAGGAQKWSTELSGSLVGGPILDDRGQVLLISAATLAPGQPMQLSAYRRSDGGLAWQNELPPLGELPYQWLLQNAAGALVTVIDGTVRAYASGGTRPPSCALWPTTRGDLGQRAAPHGT